MMKLRKSKLEKFQKSVNSLLGGKPVQLEINQGIVTIKDDKGETLFSMKGKVKIESSMRVKECEKCNSDGRKKELDALAADRKAYTEKINKLENNIKLAIKTLEG